MTLVAAFELLLIFESVIPVGCGDELGIGAVGLHIEPRESLVEAALDTARHGRRASVGLHVGSRQRVLVAEREQRAQAQRGLRVGVEQCVAYHQLRALVYPQQLLLQHHAADTIYDRGGGRVAEVGDVFVAARLVDAAITVQCEVERLLVLHDRLVERREQYVGAVAVVDRCDHQTVVLARVAAYDRRAHVASAAIGSQHLA